ncbi:MAG: hypothetical protein WBQ86_00995 [Candidatus Binatus sp.]
MNRSTQNWVDHFRWNGSVAMRVPWHIGPDLSDEERAAIAHSIQTFQLGENSEGRHLMRYAKEWAGRTGDTAYPEAIRMLIVEEQRHAGVLGRFMEINGIARIERGCTDGVFRRARNLFGSLEVSISVLVTAEIIAKIYYPALSEATASIVLRAICEQIHREEIAHVEFQTEQLARIRVGRPVWGIWATRIFHRLLFYPTLTVVGLSHRIALRRGGLSLWQFFSRCHREFVRDLAAMGPRGNSHQSKTLQVGRTTRTSSGPDSCEPTT